MNKLLIETRIPRFSDSDGIYRLVERCEPLDLNSRYAYMLVTAHFNMTSVIATHEENVIGLVSAYILPEKPDTLFVWQVAVDPDYRGKGLASLMLGDIFKRPAMRQVAFAETTISPSNTASLTLFKRFAETSGAPIKNSTFALAEDFGADAHEAELLYRVGPLDPTKLTKETN